MSYILEALRKADAERELGTGPTLPVPAAADDALPERPAPQAPSAWRWLVAGAAIPLVALLAWRLVPSTPESATAPEVVGAPLAARPGNVGGVPASAPAAAPSVVAAPTPAETVEPVAAVATASAPASAPAAAAPPAKVARKPVPKPPAAPERAAPAEPPAQAAVRPLAELPEDLRRQVPAMTIGGSVYSAEPESRMLVVNGQVVREGSTLAPGLRLERIGRQKAIFSIRGQRFEVRL